ncbi:MAG: flagellar basal body-associated protein FliL [Solirubrobacterales bacterium]
MVRLIFLAVAFLLMIGAVIGGLYFWGVDPIEKVNVLIGKAPSSPTAAVAPTAPAKSYVDFGILIVPLVQDREVKRQAEMILRLQVPFDKKEKVAQSLPRLQHFFLEDMMSFLPPRVHESGAIDTAAVSRRLVKVADRTLGAGMVEDIVIEQASLR